MLIGAIAASATAAVIIVAGLNMTFRKRRSKSLTSDEPRNPTIRFASVARTVVEKRCTRKSTAKAPRKLAELERDLAMGRAQEMLSAQQENAYWWDKTAVSHPAGAAAKAAPAFRESTH